MKKMNRLNLNYPKMFNYYVFVIEDFYGNNTDIYPFNIEDEINDRLWNSYILQYGINEDELSFEETENVWNNLSEDYQMMIKYLKLIKIKMKYEAKKS